MSYKYIVESPTLPILYEGWNGWVADWILSKAIDEFGYSTLKIINSEGAVSLICTDNTQFAGWVEENRIYIDGTLVAFR